MDEPRTHYTERSESEREKQTSCINSLYVESRKRILTSLFAGQEEGCTCGERTCGTDGERKRGVN